MQIGKLKQRETPRIRVSVRKGSIVLKRTEVRER